MARRYRPSRRAGGYAARAAFMLSERIYKREVVLKHMRRTLEFWAYYDNRELPTPLRSEVVLDFARRFRDQLTHEDQGSALKHENAAALRAVRELLNLPPTRPSVRELLAAPAPTQVQVPERM